MSRLRFRPTGAIRSALVALPLICAGCGSPTSNDQFAIAGLTPGPLTVSGWSVANPSRFVVPGTTVAAWSGPGGSSLVVYSDLPGPRVRPSSLIDERKTRLESLPDVKIRGSSLVDVGPLKAGRLDVSALGTGDALAPTGLGKSIAPDGKTLIPTHQITLGIPRSSDTLWFVWHYPESAAAKVGPAVEQMIRGLSVREDASSSSY